MTTVIIQTTPHPGNSGEYTKILGRFCFVICFFGDLARREQVLSGERRRYLCWKGGSHAIENSWAHDAFDFPVQSRQSIQAEIEVTGMVEGIGSAYSMGSGVFMGPRRSSESRQSWCLQHIENILNTADLYL